MAAKMSRGENPTVQLSDVKLDEETRRQLQDTLLAHVRSVSPRANEQMQWHASDCGSGLLVLMRDEHGVNRGIHATTDWTSTARLRKLETGTDAWIDEYRRRFVVVSTGGEQPKRTVYDVGSGRMMWIQEYDKAGAHMQLYALSDLDLYAKADESNTRMQIRSVGAEEVPARLVGSIPYNIATDRATWLLGSRILATWSRPKNVMIEDDKGSATQTTRVVFWNERGEMIAETVVPLALWWHDCVYGDRLWVSDRRSWMEIALERVENTSDSMNTPAWRVHLEKLDFADWLSSASPNGWFVHGIRPSGRYYIPPARPGRVRTHLCPHDVLMPSDPWLVGWLNWPVRSMDATH